jgi:hypothetical protein
MTKLIVRTLLAAAFLAGVAVPSRAEVRVTMQNGRVSLVAKDATLRQILAEWARAGQARIVNAEQVAGGPMTLELTDMPERQALDILMRTVGGYFAAPRPSPVPNAAFYDRIVVLPTAAPRPAVSSSSVPQVLPQARFQPTPIDDEVRAPFVTPSPQPMPASPAFQPTPAFQATPAFQPAPPAATSPAAMPSAPATGASRPGVIIPATPQQGPGTSPIGTSPINR